MGGVRLPPQWLPRHCPLLASPAVPDAALYMPVQGPADTAGQPVQAAPAETPGGDPDSRGQESRPALSRARTGPAQGADL